MSTSNFYKPEAVVPLYGDIIPAYQKAFAGGPWYEVSKCPDRLQRCAGGLSALAIGSSCELCGDCPILPAYEAAELIDRFENLAASRPTAWYVEQNDNGVTLAALAWKAKATTIANEKYSDVPAMAEWLNNNLGGNDVMWLDEVFANKELKARGNLQRFGEFVTGMAQMLETQTVAYRTKEPRMIAVPERDYGLNAKVLARQKNVPDERDFVIINLGEQR